MTDEHELLCVACDHPESEHNGGGYERKVGGHCSHKLGGGDYARICTCGAFVRPSPRQQQSANYKRPRFNQTSGRTEIGTGGSRTVNLQSSSLAKLPGEKEKDVEAVPEWVMFGIRQTDGTVTIYASTKLSYMTMRQDAPGEFEKIHIEMIRAGRLEDKPWDLRGRMVGYITAHAKNYVDALRHLMTQGWKPDGEDTEPTTADLQRQAALEDIQREDEQLARQAIEPVSDDDGIYDAEVVDE